MLSLTTAERNHLFNYMDIGLGVVLSLTTAELKN